MLVAGCSRRIWLRLADFIFQIRTRPLIVKDLGVLPVEKMGSFPFGYWPTTIVSQKTIYVDEPA
jgi:hypothetical protein